MGMGNLDITGLRNMRIVLLLPLAFPPNALAVRCVLRVYSQLINPFVLFRGVSLRAKADVSGPDLALGGHALKVRALAMCRSEEKKSELATETRVVITDRHYFIQT